MSSIVFFPYGIYVIRDTLKIPLGFRIVGQAWSQIMAHGSNFEDADSPKVAVQIGMKGDIGVIEIQDLMFTVGGPTAGAILVEWNARELTQGSVGLWGMISTHFSKEHSNMEQILISVWEGRRVLIYS